jgi:hypothetical protein
MAETAGVTIRASKRADLPGSKTLRLRTALRGIAGLAFVAFMLVAGQAQAQQGETALVGSIKDASNGAPVPDAVVTVTSPALLGEELAVTDAQGAYRILGLPPGIYTLRVEKENF